jgi:hypothetical protein
VERVQGGAVAGIAEGLERGLAFLATAVVMERGVDAGCAVGAVERSPPGAAREAGREGGEDDAEEETKGAFHGFSVM